MAEENQTDTTDNQSSATATTQSDAPAPADKGGEDASKSSGAADEGGDGTSILGGADSDAGTGDDAGGKDQATDDGTGNKAEADGPPEAYDIKPLTVGEGDDAQTIDIDSVLLEKATPILKDIGLSNEQANKLAPLALEVQSRVIQSQADEFAALRADWAKQAKADPEIGGKKWAETESLAAKALDALGAPKGSEFRRLLDDSGFGDHPDMIRIFRRAGEKIAEGDFARSEATAKTKKAPEEELYPDDLPKSKQGAK